jgi:hypothetical protein
MTVKLAWADDDDPSCSIGATFQSLSGASFVVNGAAMATDSALVTLAAEKKWLNGWSAATRYWSRSVSRACWLSIEPSSCMRKRMSVIVASDHA